jgi:hypothetical protein
MKAGSVVAVDVHGRQWPAYVGLVLAISLVLAAVAQLAQRPSGMRAGWGSGQVRSGEGRRKTFAGPQLPEGAR